MDSDLSEKVDWISKLNHIEPKGIKYAIVSEPHDPDFMWVMAVRHRGETIGTGRAKKKRLAEHLAAKQAVEMFRQRRRTLHKAMGQASNQLGLRQEELVVRAFDAADSLPGWFHSIRLKDGDEDRRGIDAVVETHDLGNLMLQVKSSFRGAEKFFSKGRRSTLIGVVIVKHVDGPLTIRLNVLKVCETLRRQILNLREQRQNDEAT